MSHVDQSLKMVDCLRLVVFAGMLVGITNSSLNRRGRNVCSHLERRSRLEYRTCKRTTVEHYKTECNAWGRFWKFTGWNNKCTRRRPKVESWSCTYAVYYMETVYSCCPGWKQSGNECPIPVCAGGCRNGGQCVQAEVCSCPAGWIGNRCQEPCPRWHYGKECKKLCTCDQEKTSECMATNGECKCQAGYQGERCELLCHSGSFGQDCAFKCSCSSTGTKRCDSMTGKCVCLPGWQGVSCSSECPPGKFGHGCIQTCQCDHNRSVNAVCHTATGQCVCKEGFVSLHCNMTVDEYDVFCQNSKGSDYKFWISVAVGIFLLCVVIVLAVKYLRQRSTAKVYPESVKEHVCEQHEGGECLSKTSLLNTSTPYWCRLVRENPPPYELAELPITDGALGRNATGEMTIDDDKKFSFDNVL